MNLTIDTINTMIPFDKQRCLEQALELCNKVQYEFVWIFVIAFFFNELRGYIHYVDNLTPKMRTQIDSGLKSGSFWLNIVGILYFIGLLRGLI